MNASEAIRGSFNMVRGFSTSLFQDMADAPLTRAVPERGNHPYWILGHVVVSEASLLDCYVLGRPNRHEAWLPLFKFGTSPGSDMKGGPTYAALLEALETLHADVDGYLETVTNDALGRPCHRPENAGPPFETIAECLNAMSIHLGFHAGQIADTRRAAGRQPLMM